MRFGKRGKLNPRCIGPFKILEHIGPVAYRFPLPPNFSNVHIVIQVSMSKIYHVDSDLSLGGT